MSRPDAKAAQVEHARLEHHRANIDTTGEIIPAADRIDNPTEAAEAVAVFNLALSANRYYQLPTIEMPGLKVHWLGAIGVNDAVDIEVMTGENSVTFITLQVPGWVPYVPRDRTDVDGLNLRCGDAIERLEHARDLAALPPTILSRAMTLTDLREAIASATRALTTIEDALADASDKFPRWSRPPRGAVPRIAGFDIKWPRV
ncbi:MAG: hypothetical protein IPK59_00610 [Rhodospirillaceae bacterium]|nr:hypothetical protein [Rhodospirillaceae bacterium]